LKFLQKNQDGGDIRVGRFFSSQKFKKEIFQKTLPRFVVPSSTKVLQKSVFENLSMNKDFSIL
jgi:hypothetical protein